MPKPLGPSSYSAPFPMFPWHPTVKASSSFAGPSTYNTTSLLKGAVGRNPPPQSQEGREPSDFKGPFSSLPTEEQSSYFIMLLLSYKKFSISFYSHKQIIPNYITVRAVMRIMCTQRSVQSQKWPLSSRTQQTFGC